MRALRIVSCSDSMMWYSHLVGELVPLLAVEKVEYKSREPAGYVNFVKLCDGKVEEVDEGI